MKIRAGCEGGGKGPLIQEEKSATLATHTDQTLFTYGFSGQAGPGAGMTATEETSPTLKVKQIENVAVGFMAGQGAKARSVGAAVEVSPTLKACASGLNQAPSVVSLMGNIVDRQAGQNGSGIKTDGTSYTLDTISRHGVAYKNKTSEEAK